jgi:hypothetical protein
VGGFETLPYETTLLHCIMPVDCRASEIQPTLFRKTSPQR